MQNSLGRRCFSLIALSVLLLISCSFKETAASAEDQLMALEKTQGGRLGVFALNTANGRQLGYRANERFPFCSTFKAMLAGAALKRSMEIKGFMQQRVKYSQNDLVTYSPITEKHVGEGMTVEQLCVAASQYSDNTAANLLINKLGGIREINMFARSMGDNTFRLDRMETMLTSGIPEDVRDTSSPLAMAHSLQKMVLGDTLSQPQREQLKIWLIGNTTGAKRIRSGVPPDWIVANRTGGGDYGVANDIAVLWPPNRAPLVVAIFTSQREQNAKPREDVIAAAARIIVEWANQPD